MDLWKVLTAVVSILILMMAIFIVWNSVINPRIAPQKVEKIRDISFEVISPQFNPVFGATADCLAESKSNGAPASYLSYSCTVDYWAQPYYRGARIQDYEENDKVGAIYHHICRCTFTYLE